MYDFDTVFLREGMGAAKWDEAARQGCPGGTVPLTVADMEFATAPEVIEAALATARTGRWGYTEASPGFAAAVRGWMRERHGWDAREEWMVNSPGVVPALFAAVRALTRPGDGVLVQPPVYYPFLAAASYGGRKCVENPLKICNGRYEIDFEHLEQCAPRCKLMIFCSPHNPVGRVWSAEDVRRVAEICAAHGVILLADEIHCDLVMPGHAFFSAGRLPAPLLENTVIATSACKTFSLAGLACASVFVPGAQTRVALGGALRDAAVSMNTAFGVPATEAAYTRGGPWLAELISYLCANARVAAEYLEQNIHSVKMTPPEGTYLGWMDFGALGMEKERLHAFLREKARFYAQPGEDFGTGGEGFVRVNMACPRAVLLGALQRVAAAVRGL